MTTRQELYDRIRASTKQEVILEEMIRLGFWPRDQDLDASADVERAKELNQQLRALTSENSRLQNVEALKKAARQRRMEESRRKRKETKERRLRERAERAEAWQARKATEIHYLGQGVSGGLSHQQGNDEKLAKRGLPVLRDAAELAAALQISVGELRFLAFHRRTSRTTHYRRFAIPKKTGGLRNISAPMPRLKRAQEWVLWNLLEKIELHQAAHGFQRGRSIVSNARPHVGGDVVINVDLEDFFPTITYARIRGLFRSFGYSEQVATILALLCSEPEVTEVAIDNQTYFVAQSQRYLPQGAPSSPAITNILCRGMDARLQDAANKLGFVYTRYADDITLSGSGEAVANIGRMLRRVEHVVGAEGFRLHPKKTRVLRKGSRQEVTGLVVNERVNVSRQELRRFRATLFQIERDGPAGKRWGSSPHVLEAIEGFANFVAMVDAERGAELQRRVRAILDKYGRGERPARSNRWQPRPFAAAGSTSETATASSSPSQPSITPPQPATERKQADKPWWKFW